MNPELECLFSSEGLNPPVWLQNVVDHVQRKGLAGKSARHAVYREIWKKIQGSKNSTRMKTVVYPIELVECINVIFPGEKGHQDYGPPNITIRKIAML